MNRNVLLLIALLASRPAHGEGKGHLSPRSEARGGTGVAGFRDDPSALANPASLAGEQGFEMRYLDLRVAYNDNAKRTVKHYKKLSEDQGLGFLEEFADRLGQEQYLSVSAFPLGVRRASFDVAPFYTSTGGFQLRDPGLTRVDASFETEIGARLAGAWQVQPSLAVGASLRPRHFKTSVGRFSIAEAAAAGAKGGPKGLLETRSGNDAAVDLGATYTSPWATRFAALVTDIGDTASFTKAAEPEPTPHRLRVGALHRMNFGNNLVSDNYIDVEDLGNVEGRSLLRRTHLGAEFGLAVPNGVLANGVALGLDDGYVTGGVFASLWLIRFTATRYTKELGAYAGQKKDLRTAFALSFVHSF